MAGVSVMGMANMSTIRNGTQARFDSLRHTMQSVPEDVMSDIDEQKNPETRCIVV